MDDYSKYKKIKNNLNFSTQEDLSNNINDYKNKELLINNSKRKIDSLSYPERLNNNNYNFIKFNKNKIRNNSIKLKKDKNNKEYNEEDDKIEDKNENLNSNYSNFLNYNYLESEKNQNGEEETCNKSLEEIINDLKAENKELRNDMKKLYFLTQENKNNLIEHIQILKDENYKLKNEKKELEYRLLINEKKNNELKADNENYINENKIIQQRCLNEIKELNCQLNNYKIKLNNISLNYDQLLNDFHYIKKEKIFQMSDPIYSFPSKNNNEEKNEN